MIPAKRKRWSQRVTETSHALDLEAAKDELRDAFGRPQRGRSNAGAKRS